jgi:hypothetical protein
MIFNNFAGFLVFMWKTTAFIDDVKKEHPIGVLFVVLRVE